MCRFKVLCLTLGLYAPLAFFQPGYHLQNSQSPSVLFPTAPLAQPITQPALAASVPEVAPVAVVEPQPLMRISADDQAVLIEVQNFLYQKENAQGPDALSPEERALLGFADEVPEEEGVQEENEAAGVADPVTSGPLTGGEVAGIAAGGAGALLAVASIIGYKSYFKKSSRLKRLISAELKLSQKRLRQAEGVGNIAEQEEFGKKIAELKSMSKQVKQKDQGEIENLLEAHKANIQALKNRAAPGPMPSAPPAPVPAAKSLPFNPNSPEGQALLSRRRRGLSFDTTDFRPVAAQAEPQASSRREVADVPEMPLERPLFKPRMARRAQALPAQPTELSALDALVSTPAASPPATSGLNLLDSGQGLDVLRGAARQQEAAGRAAIPTVRASLSTQEKLRQAEHLQAQARAEQAQERLQQARSVTGAGAVRWMRSAKKEFKRAQAEQRRLESSVAKQPGFIERMKKRFKK